MISAVDYDADYAEDYMRYATPIDRIDNRFGGVINSGVCFMPLIGDFFMASTA